MTDRETGASSAVDAKSRAQQLAFGPFSFWATVVLRDSGLLEAVAAGGNETRTIESLAEASGLPEYGASLLLEFGAHLGLVEKKESGFSLGNVGHFVLHDEMTNVNMNFTRDVCYEALPFLEESLREQHPAGLKVHGPWESLYKGLGEFPEDVEDSWLRFDHFYSDRAFQSLLPVVFEEPVDQLLDVGGNTGRWARQCLAYDDSVSVTLLDLPGLIERAKEENAEAGFTDRTNYVPMDLREEEIRFPDGMDVIWMSQLLDCFSEQDVLRILHEAASVMDENARLFIVELFPDRQDFEAASFSLDAISLYFACLANGESRMYRFSSFQDLVQEAGLEITRDIDVPSSEHTALVCRRQ